jgi:hypothetical protein
MRMVLGLDLLDGETLVTGPASRSKRMRAKRAINVSQRARHIARLAQILRYAKKRLLRMTNILLFEDAVV